METYLENMPPRDKIMLNKYVSDRMLFIHYMMTSFFLCVIFYLGPILIKNVKFPIDGWYPFPTVANSIILHPTAYFHIIWHHLSYL